MEFKVSDAKTLPWMIANILEHELHTKRGMLKELCTRYLTAFLNKDILTSKKYYWTKYGVRHSRPRVVVVLALENSKPVGCLFLQGWWLHFYVPLSHRRQGLASRMFEVLDSQVDLSSHVLTTGHSAAVKKLRRKYGLVHLMKDFKRQNREFKNEQVR